MYKVSKKEKKRTTSFGMQISREFYFGNLSIPMAVQRIERKP